MMSRRLLNAASSGALIGAMASLLTALGDYGALWLWLPLWDDRAALLVRLVSIELPVGACAGALLAVIAALAEQPIARLARRLARARRPARDDDGAEALERRWRARLWPLPFVPLLAPGVVVVGNLLFSGGKMSRIGGRGALVAVATLVLVSLAWLVLAAGRRAYERANELPSSKARWFAVTALVASLAASKIDQTAYPNLYGYLHACLAVCAWSLAWLAVAIAAAHSRRARALRESPRLPIAGLAAVALSIAIFVISTNTLDSNLNVRVALFDPRASTSRSLMMALEPVLASDDAESGDAVARRRQRRERERRRLAALAPGLPILDDADVLLVTIDALRADHLGTYGYARGVSPNIDALARRSVAFDRAYTQAPHSSYSISSLMTSEYLHETLELGQPPPHVTLASALRDSGYYTAAFYTLGIFHTEGERLRVYHDDAYGFARHDHMHCEAPCMTDRALAEVDRIAQRGEPPSLLWVHYFDAHEPYMTTRLGSSDIDRYDGEIAEVDHEVARLIAGVRRRLHRRLVIILTADHGEEFRDHGGVYHGSTLYEEQTHVPLIVQAPGFAPRRVSAPVELIDVAPTVLGLLGIELPPSMRGKDLRPLVMGRVDDVGPAFSAVISKRMVVAPPYKLIADLRFGLYELYDLSRDPRERRNLANSDPARLQALRSEIYAWLDSLATSPAEREGVAQQDPRHRALDRGRLGDRRSVPALCALLLDPSAPLDARREAGQILGKLADPSSVDQLYRGLADADPLVAAEAAIALGRMYNNRGQRALRGLVHSEDPDIRTRAAVSLGRLRDREAVPALIEAMQIAPTMYDREEAIRWLGRLRDSRALEPLLAAVPELRTRSLVVIALGALGDRRAYATLSEMLDWEHHTDIRDNVVRGLGMLGDPRAIARLATMAADERDMTNVPEALVRLDAAHAGAVGGTDVRAGLHARGFLRCHTDPAHHDWNYMRRTYCDMKGAASLRGSVPPAVATSTGGAVVLIGMRRADTTAPVDVTLRIGNATLGPIRVDQQWADFRLALDAAPRHAGSVPIAIEASDRDAEVSVDHVLIVPKRAAVASAAPARSE